MRRIMILITISLFATVLFASCSNTYNCNDIAVSSDVKLKAKTDNISEAEIENNSIAKYITEEKPMFTNISFDSIKGADRASRNADSSLIISGNACKGSDEFAVCIATVKKIDKNGCSPEIGKILPVTLHIDAIIERTSTFSLESNDTVVVAEYSSWFKNEVGYTVAYQDGFIPITEEGSQYILYIYGVDENIAKDFWPGLKYRVEALTIPICYDSDLSKIEVYEALNLPDDVIQCSEDLINHFVIE